MVTDTPVGSTRRTVLALLTSAVVPIFGAAATTRVSRDNADAETPEAYGAIGNGVADDTAAFQALSRAVTVRGGGTIILRRNAIYRVGRQTFSGAFDGAAFRHQDMMTIKSARGLKIVGNGATLKLNDGLYYGSFHPVTKQAHRPQKGDFSDPHYAATVGWMINLVDCDDVTVSNLVLDGNQDKLIIGGHWGDTGIQLRAVGLNLDGVTRATIQHVTSRSHGLDGFYIRTRGRESVDGAWAGITFRDCHADRNGRQGLSITGGRGMLFENCTFTNTGQGRISSLPQAGIDIEPNGRDWATAIRFSGGRVENNKGVGILTPRGVNVADVIIQDMEIWQGFAKGPASRGSSDAFWFSAPLVTIKGCKIHGCVTNTVSTTKVVGCRWDDRSHPVYGRSAQNRDYLLSNPQGTYRDIRFETTNRKMIYAGKESHFRNCVFIDNGPKTGARRILALFGPSTTLVDCDFGRNMIVNTKDSWRTVRHGR